MSSRKDKEEIIVPSSSLYIEALPGKHPILEDFKLMHRAIDVKKALAEVNKSEINNLRYVKRILDGDYENPDIETRKKLYIQSNTDPSINVDAG